MKNFSTVGRSLAGAAPAGRAVSVPLAALIAVLAMPAGAVERCEFKPNAPDQHQVVKGDTLWDISGTFLQHPWCWPQVWGMNKEEIRNPHWIYPGQIIYFDRANRRLSLTRPGAGGGSDGLAGGTLKLSPQVRTEGLGRDAIAAIPGNVVEPFLTRPLVVEADELKGAPRIVAAAAGHMFLGKDDKVYVRGELKGLSSFHVFRPGTVLKDPVSGKLLAHEAVYLGAVKLQQEARPGSDVHTFIVSDSKQEIGIGDLLIPAPPAPIRNYMPHPPETAVDARVLGIYSGVNYAGQNMVVSVNRGTLDGIDVGTVLQLYNQGRTIHDRTADKGMFGMSKPKIRLPDEQSGTLFIFRTFKHISYGLIMQVTEPVEVGDVARSPE